MRTVGLSPRMAAVDAVSAERSEEAAIESEIATRFIELQETTSASRATQFLSKLYAIYQAEPAALWVLLRIMSGDLSEITRSYSDMGRDGSKSKQAVQQSLERVLVVIERHYPGAATAIVQLRGITANYREEDRPIV